MTKQILYLGDTTLDTAASYLAGLMSHAGWSFDYVPSEHALRADRFAPRPQLLIISDYPAAQIATPIQELIARCAADGMGLLMIGGWESYHGLGGDWDGTPIANLLPVLMQDRDDRVNCDQPALVRASQEHAILAGLPWASRPPTVGGYNRFDASPVGLTLLEVERFRVAVDDSGEPHGERAEIRFESAGIDPLLVVGVCGIGRVAALATDVAPHWVGGLVDWGDGRVAAQAPEAEAVEVGDLYAQFFQQLLGWTGQF